MLKRIQRISGWTFLVAISTCLVFSVLANILEAQVGIEGKWWRFPLWGILIGSYVISGVSSHAFIGIWLLQKVKSSGPRYTTPVERQPVERRK